MSDEVWDSELGKLEYWQKAYKNEIANFRRNGDVGEIWFGEDIEERIVQWMNKNGDKQSSILEVGCGNGMLLISLAQNGFQNLNGIDYVQDAITLAKEISAKYNTNIKFDVGDILHLKDTQHDIIVDKGTYDAISLMSDSKLKRDIYLNNISNCLKGSGVLVITSCNWTKEELQSHFINKFSMYDIIPTPQFVFGGRIGNVVSSVIFKKNVS